MTVSTLPFKKAMEMPFLSKPSKKHSVNGFCTCDPVLSRHFRQSECALDAIKTTSFLQQTGLLTQTKERNVSQREQVTYQFRTAADGITEHSREVQDQRGNKKPATIQYIVQPMCSHNLLSILESLHGNMEYKTKEQRKWDFQVSSPCCKERERKTLQSAFKHKQNRNTRGTSGGRLPVKMGGSNAGKAQIFVREIFCPMATKSNSSGSKFHHLLGGVLHVCGATTVCNLYAI